MKLSFFLVVLSATLAAQSMISGEQKQNPLAGQKDAIQAGQQRFREGCAACHGANAEGGRGPRLVKNRDLYRMTDQDLFNTIQKGIPGTSMPPSQMPDDKTWQVVSFVRSLSSPAFRAFVEGDAAHGRELYFGSGHCDRCHAIRGQGGLQGPDLSDVGGHITLPELHETLEKSPSDLTPGFRSVIVHMKDGSTINGVAKDDSGYALDVLSRDSQLHSIDKASVSAIDWGHDSTTHSGIAQQLGPSGVQDVIAFVAQQVIRPNPEAPMRRRREIH